MQRNISEISLHPLHNLLTYCDSLINVVIISSSIHNNSLSLLVNYMIIFVIAEAYNKLLNLNLQQGSRKNIVYCSDTVQLVSVRSWPLPSRFSNSNKMLILKKKKEMLAILIAFL